MTKRLSSWVSSNCKFAGWDGTRTLTDYDRRAQQAHIQHSEAGYSVFNLADNEYIMTFPKEAEAKEFAKEYDEANLKRKGVAKVWEKFRPLSVDHAGSVNDEAKILKMPDSKFEQEQAKRDVILAPFNQMERRERFKKLRNNGLPHVPEVKEELEKHRTHPARPHGQELPAPRGVPDVPSISDLDVVRRKNVAWVRSNCKFAQHQPNLDVTSVLTDYFKRVGAQGYPDIIHALRGMIYEGEIPLTGDQTPENLAMRISRRLGFTDIPGYDEETDHPGVEPLSISYDDNGDKLINYEKPTPFQK